MSQESAEWLNNMTLIGFVAQRGKAWHYAEALQGDEPNHYDGSVPVEDVRRRLLSWEAESGPLFVQRGDEFVQVPGRQAVFRSDTGDVLGVFTDAYQPHQYDEWLVRNVENILDDTLQIGSAGLLKNGAQCWVSAEVSENLSTKEGVKFRPQLIAATSFDGSLATTYKRSATIVVCDNTLAAGLSGSGELFRLKHTRYSTGRIAEARTALGIVYETADATTKAIDELMRTPVTKEQMDLVLDIIVPLTGPDGKPIEAGRSRTMHENKRDEILRLYRKDDMVAPFAGTAFGVVQAFNTYQHHSSIVRGTSRVQRNKTRALGDEVAASDAATIDALEKVLDLTLLEGTKV